MMSDEDNGRSLMGQIEHLEGLLQNLKQIAVASDTSNNKERILANAIISEHKNISNCLDQMEQSAQEEAQVMIMDFMNIADDDDLDMDEESWSNLHDSIKFLEGKSEEFQICSLCLSFGGKATTFIHEVCSKKPPAEVVRILLDIIPINTEKDCWSGRIHQYNHLACNKDGFYPLHKVLQNGGSLEVVKLLVNADSEKQTLQMVKEDKDSVYHVLIANREVHQPEVFSEILRYLCCIGIGTDQSALHQQANLHQMKTPVLLLVQSLINKEGLNYQDILKNSDFVFLLKATCYHYVSQSSAGTPQTKDIHLVHRDIEAISLSEAFLVCAPCFNDKIIDKVLNDILSVDCQFLFKKDSFGQYPIHRIINKRPSYFVDTTNTYRFDDFLSYILEIVLKHAPQCAQQVNAEGRLPLHIVSDAQEDKYTDNRRLKRVEIIWNAYPDAAEKLDCKTGLPPFALAVRGKDKDEDTKKNDPEDSMMDIMFSNTTSPLYTASSEG